MTTVRREAPSEMEEAVYIAEWRYDCLTRDLAAGRHAVGCECSTTHLEADNACLGIAVAMRDLAAYEIEVET